MTSTIDAHPLFLPVMITSDVLPCAIFHGLGGTPEVKAGAKGPVLARGQYHGLHRTVRLEFRQRRSARLRRGRKKGAIPVHDRGLISVKDICSQKDAVFVGLRASQRTCALLCQSNNCRTWVVAMPRMLGLFVSCRVAT